MYVVRPRAIMSTPRLVAHDLGWKTRYAPNPRRVKPYDYSRDFFMYPVNRPLNAPPEYGHVTDFFGRGKAGQRRWLWESGLNVPTVDYGLGYVVRPFRHHGGENYRVTQDVLDYDQTTEYIAPVYPKRREYRVVFVFGQPLIYLRKKPHEGVAQDAPWGHVNSLFQTINDIPSCRLSATDCVSRLSVLPVVRHSHIVAADILWNDKVTQPYVVLELNSCPALTIDDNRAKVVEALRGRNQVSVQQPA